MKHLKRIFCLAVIVICVAFVIKGISHVEAVNRLLNDVGLSQLNVDKELFYDSFDMGLGYKDGYEALVILLKTDANTEISKHIEQEVTWSHGTFTFSQILEQIPRGYDPGVAESISPKASQITYSAYRVIKAKMSIFSMRIANLIEFYLYTERILLLQSEISAKQTVKYFYIQDVM